MAQLIMVVATTSTLLGAYHTLLTAEGYCVYTRPSFKEVFSLAVEMRPHLIITDLLMDDDKEALELVEQLRGEDSPIATIPLILSSTKNRFTSHLENQLSADANIRLVPKPFDTKLILTEVTALLA